MINGLKFEVFQCNNVRTSALFSRLHMRRVKGSGGGDKLCYCPQNVTENRFFRPTGIYIIRTMKGEDAASYR